jgi:hypothetical protein
MKYFYNLVVVGFLTAAVTYSYNSSIKPDISLKRGDRVKYVLSADYEQRLADIVNNCNTVFIASQALEFKNEAFILVKECSLPGLQNAEFTLIVDLKNLKKI